MKARDYEHAIERFREAVTLAPERADIRKDLGYALLRAGETEEARDVFAAAMAVAPEDDNLALEYAFLAYETKHQAAARRTFDRLRRKGNAVAEQTFQDIDRQLAKGIERWQRAVELAPGSFSAHEELARLAEQRDQLELAALHYERAWRLRPDLRSYLLALGRVWNVIGKREEATAALLAASRGVESRSAEAAKELLPARYPWVYEFRAALALDPDNLALRRELAWLLLAMGQKAEAEAEFQLVVKAAPDDAWSLAQLGFLLLARNSIAEAMPLLERALVAEDNDLADRVRSALQLPRTFRKRNDTPQRQTSAQALELAQRSLDAGYLKDAIKYLRIAHENDPLDFTVMLKLGWTYNIVRDDRSATDWFALARRAPDDAVASEAQRAWSNLHPQFARIRTTTWMYPFYSSRWNDVFSYAQVQTEIMPRWPVRPYLSLRFIGDVRQTARPGELGDAIGPGYLSDSAMILAAGLKTRSWNGARAWIEAGTAFTYVNRPHQPRFEPDLRGGVAWSRSFGRNLGSETRGWFEETNADVVYIGRSGRDTLFYVQNRGGYTLAPNLQLTWSMNVTADARRYQWANTAETGPGIRMKIMAGPSPLILSFEALQGTYTIAGPRALRYTDIRAGLWYALTH